MFLSAQVETRKYLNSHLLYAIFFQFQNTAAFQFFCPFFYLKLTMTFFFNLTRRILDTNSIRQILKPSLKPDPYCFHVRRRDVNASVTTTFHLCLGDPSDVHASTQQTNIQLKPRTYVRNVSKGALSILNRFEIQSSKVPSSRFYVSPLG